jgi:hypothetical protein
MIGAESTEILEPLSHLRLKGDLIEWRNVTEMHPFQRLHQIHNWIIKLEQNRETKQHIFMELKRELDLGNHLEFISLFVQRLVQRGFGEEFYHRWRPLNFAHWNVFSESVMEFIIRLEVKNSFSNSLEFARQMQEVFGSEITHPALRKFVNFDAIKNTDIELYKVDGLVIWVSKLPLSHPCHPQRLLNQLLTVWNHPEFVLEAPFAYMERVAVGIVSSLRVCKGQEYARILVEKFLNSVTKYLESTREDVRNLGLLVAQLCSQEFTPNNRLSLIDSVPEEFMYLQKLLKNPWEETACPKVLQDSQEIPYFSPLDFHTKRPDGRVYFASRNDKDLTPIFIKQCVDMIKKNEPADVEVGLRSLVSIINKASATEVHEYCKELCYTLVYLHNDFDLDNFDVMVSNALIAVALRNDHFGYLLAYYFCQKQITVASQLRILRMFLCIPMLFLQKDRNELVVHREVSTGQSVQYFSKNFALNLFGLLNRTSFDIHDQTGHKAHLIQQLIKTLNLLTMMAKDGDLYHHLAVFLLSFRTRKVYLHYKSELTNGVRVLVQSDWSNQMDPILIDIMSFSELLMK